MHTGTNVRPNATSPTTPSRQRIDLSALSVDELELLLREIRQHLGAERLQQMTNENSVSVRLPLEACDKVRALAMRFNTTRSRVLRQAVLEFTARHSR